MLFKKRLMTPGPTEVPPSVLAEAAKPIMHHRTPQFREILTKVVADLKNVFKTQNDLLIFPAAGTGGMESAVTNLCSPNDQILVASCGHFGNRWADIAKAYGVQVEHYEVEWGQPVDPEEVAKRLKANPAITAVYATLSETSTGTETNIRRLGEIVAETPAVLVVDAISGLGAIPLLTDDWKVDVVVCGAQKGLMIPPGLAMISISAKAWEKAKIAQCPKYYFSWAKAQKAMKAEALADTPYTPNISLILQLSESLRLLQQEGLEAVWARHAKLAEAARQAMRALGLRLYSEKQPSNAVTAIHVPEGVDGGKLVKTIRDVYGITMAGGQGKAKGKIFRIGHLGFADDWDLLSAVAAVERSLLEQKFPITLGQGVTTAEKVLFSTTTA
jgi:serine---pyruvate transaminase